MDTTHTPLDRITAIKRLYRVPHTFALLIESLLINQVTSVDSLVGFGVAPSAASARVVIHKVRKAFFTPRNIKVEQQQSLGYWLNKDDRKMLDVELEGFISEGSSQTGGSANGS